MNKHPIPFDWSELPVIQAPMAGVQDHRLAAAVCNAGGLGSLPAALMSAETLQSELAALCAATSRPFNVNFFCHDLPDPDPAREAAWRARLAPYYGELGLDLESIPAIPLRRPFSEEALDVIECIRPAVVSFHFGLPAPKLLARVKSLGCRILGCATTLEEARWLEARGVDAIVAQGVEAGGHRGLFLSSDLDQQVSTQDLLKAVVARVSVPVIAAGGIATAADVAAARARGAAAVQAGSAYLLCPEATTPAVHRAALASPAVHESAITNLFTGRPARGMVNRLMRELHPMNPVAPPFPYAATAIAPLRTAAEQRGLPDFSPLWCGTKAPACRAVPAREITAMFAAGWN